MRAEDIVGTCFFAMLIPSVLVAISGSRTSLAPRQKALWRGCGLSLMSGVLITFGLVNFFFIHNSPKPVVEGNLWDVREESSNRAHSSRFEITDKTGHATLIRCSYTGPGLQPGELARIRYVAYNRKLLELDLLSGPYQAWHLREPSGEEGFWTWAAIGVVCGLFAIGQMAKIGQGNTIASR